MKKLDAESLGRWLPLVFALAAVGAFAWWISQGPTREVKQRDYIPDEGELASGAGGTNPVYAGKLIAGEGKPEELPGAWPRFRGARLDGISTEEVRLARTFASGGPSQLWSTAVGEGYAGAAIWKGRVFIMDYDQAKKQDAVRCLSLADGKEIWRYAYPVSVKRNHGMSRTVPTITDKELLAISPKCYVISLDPMTGQLRWALDLVKQFGATVPQWYAGQCPLIDNGRLILGIGGTNALMAAIDLSNGQPIWTTPNPNGWLMTHSSVMPAEFNGKKMYVYCASQGVVGVDAADGKLLWETPDWKISIANVPSPVVLDGGRIFLSGGYGAGSMMLQLATEGDRIIPKTAFKLGAKVFGATQHTPILLGGNLYAIREDGQLVCLSLEGKVLWASGPKQKFGLGPLMAADGLLLALSEDGTLRLVEAKPDAYKALAEHKIVGHEAWGPMALAGGRLVARDLTSMVCVDLRAPAGQQ